MRTTLCLAFALGFIAASNAHAATFTAKAEDGSVTIYSTAKKPEYCGVYVRFTYLSDGQRKDGFTSCGKTTVKPGKNVELCRFSNPQIVAPLLKGDVISECPPKDTK
jgi:hypothetical protein